MAEDELYKNLNKLQNYFTKWDLTIDPNKTVTVTFPLNNREAHRKLGIKIGDTFIVNEESPRNLTVKIDKSITFKKTSRRSKN